MSFLYQCTICPQRHSETSPIGELHKALMENDKLAAALEVNVAPELMEVALGLVDEREAERDHYKAAAETYRTALLGDGKECPCCGEKDGRHDPLCELAELEAERAEVPNV